MKICSLVWLLCWVSIWGGVSVWANASAEGKDYLVCKRLAVKYLERCLQDQSHEDADSCWSESKRVYQTCREDTIDQEHSTEAGIHSDSSAAQYQQPQQAQQPQQYQQPQKAPASQVAPAQSEQEKISEVRKIRGMM